MPAPIFNPKYRVPRKRACPRVSKVKCLNARTQVWARICSAPGYYNRLLSDVFMRLNPAPVWPPSRMPCGVLRGRPPCAVWPSVQGRNGRRKSGTTSYFIFSWSTAPAYPHIPFKSLIQYWNISIIPKWSSRTIIRRLSLLFLSNSDI
jgi:hypothetical protein